MKQCERRVDNMLYHKFLHAIELSCACGVVALCGAIGNIFTKYSVVARNTVANH